MVSFLQCSSTALHTWLQQHVQWGIGIAVGMQKSLLGCRKLLLDKAPEPAVSVPRAKLTNPDPTATPDPEDDPPGMNLQNQIW